ncbi:MAG: FHA domain-containing protein [Alkalinema sp. CAN_BIN05]|nr:FHA domain-containing protein [Alkalinema sp. CAN_BIN05]
MNLEPNSLQTSVHPISVDFGEINWEEHAPKISLDSALWTDESLINPIETSVMEETPAFNSTEFKSAAAHNWARTDRVDSPFFRHDRSQEIDADLVKPQPHYVQGVIRGQQAYIITNLCNQVSSTLFQPQMTWSIGRNRQAAIPLRDRMLSRHHAVLMYVRNAGFHLLDLNSMNGSYINGVRVENRASLKDGDFVRVGNTEFFFFVSNGYRNLDPLHSEVLTRLVNPEAKSSHVDYSELKEEISFNLH